MAQHDSQASTMTNFGGLRLFRRSLMEDGMDINARLEKLEGENRRMKKIGIVAAVVVSAVDLAGITSPGPPQAQKE